MDDFQSESVLYRNKHVKFLDRNLRILPPFLSAYDQHRLTLAFFTISGLDLLNALDENIKDRDEVINWIYSLQVLPDPLGNESADCRHCGFQGSSILIFLKSNIGQCSNIKNYASSHIAMTYTGLACLLILGDDLSRANKSAILNGVRALQQEDGSFCATLGGSECSMRFVYCAACICYIFQDWSGMDISKTLDYIRNSISYDYGIGEGPGLEAHGGTTFCAVATVALMGKLHSFFTKKEIEGLTNWCILRQDSGFHGRPNKPVDTCYSFWIGATLKLLGALDMVNFEANRKYVLSTQDEIAGGFSKWVGTRPDPLHTYLGLGGLSLMEDDDSLLSVHPGLNISMRAHSYLQKLQKQWQNNSPW